MDCTVYLRIETLVPRKSALLIGWMILSASASGQPRDVRLLFTGDILLSRQVAVEMEGRKASPWVNFAELFHNADWVAGNFEGSVGSGCEPNANPCFATSDSAAALMKSAGFSAVTVENNHSGDLGQPGRDRTRRVFRDDGIMALDFNGSPEFVRFGETTVGILSVTLIKAADGRVQRIPSVELAQKLRLACSIESCDRLDPLGQRTAGLAQRLAARAGALADRSRRGAGRWPSSSRRSSAGVC